MNFLKKNITLASVFIVMLMGISETLDAQKMRHRAPSRNMSTHKSSSRTINGGHHNVTKKRNTTVRSKRNSTVNHNVTKNRNTNIKTKRNTTVNNNVNINVNRNTHYSHGRAHHARVRSSHRVYVRPPYRHGGFFYYSYHPYYYHPYRPYRWGPRWYPWGYVTTTLVATAILIDNANDQPDYYYDNGMYYLKTADGYIATEPVDGTKVKELPKETQVVAVSETTNNYYYGGVYYEKANGEYTVVSPTAGTIVDGVPQGAEEIKIGDQTYVKYGETYYLPVQLDGKNKYEIAEVKPEE